MAGTTRTGTTGTTRPVFGVLLRRYRRAAELTQEDLAARTGYSTVHIGMLERGQRRPRLTTVALLADALALDAQDRALLVAAARQQESAAARTDPATSAGPVLVGRAHEAEALERHLVGEGPPVLLLAGEPGIGKTRLLQEAAVLGEACGWQVLRGGCQRRGRAPTQWEGEPYAPLLEALERYIRDAEPARAWQSLAGCTWLVRLLPELTEVGLEPPAAGVLAPEQERRQVVRALGRFLGQAQGPAGTLLVLDDLQWAGPDALEVLVALLRGLAPHSTGGSRGAGGGALRVVGAYRDSEVGPGDPLWGALAELVQGGLVRQVSLGPLQREDAEALLDRLLARAGAGETDAGGAAAAGARGHGVRAQVLERAGGVPFALVSYAQALRAGTAGGARVPWDLAQSVRGRVAALPAGAREALQVLAVVGRAAPQSVLQAVLRRSEEEVLGELEAACRARLLEEDGDGYLFAHDVIREVVEEDLGLTRRLALHRRVAEVLERGPGEAAAEVLAYHYAQGGMPERAVVYLEAAGERARRRGAHAAAEGYYREAIAGLEELGQAAEAARVREKLGVVLATAARYDEALAVLEEAATAYRAVGDLESLGRTVAAIGNVYADSGRPEEGIRRLRPLLAPLERAGARRGLAALYTALSGLFFVSGRYDEQMAAAARATELAQAMGDSKLLLDIRLRRGMALAMTEQTAEALRVLEEGIHLAEEIDDLDSLSRALNNVAAIYINMGELSRSTPYANRAVEVADRLGDPLRLVRIVCTRGSIAFFSGDWRRARADFERAMAMNQQVGPSSGYAYPVFYLGFLRLGEGDWPEAARLLDESMRIAESMGDLQVLRWACAARAWVDLLEGQPARARERLTALLDQSTWEGEGVSWLLLFLAWAYLDLGTVERAQEVVARAIAAAVATRDNLSRVDALWVQAMVLARRQRWAEARRVLEEGLALARAMPYPCAEGRLLHVYGAMLAEKGEPQLAREQLVVALAIFRRLGARKESERVEEVLARARQQGWQARAAAQVSEAQWARIQAVLPPPARTGRRRADDRRTLEAILYVQRTRCAWHELPADLGDEVTAHRRLREWRRAGLWERIEAILREGPAAIPGEAPAGGDGERPRSERA